MSQWPHIIDFIGYDYISATLSLVFLPDSSVSHIQCRNISIVSDEVVEETEELFVNIQSSDLSVRLLISMSSVLVIDSNSK